MKKPIWLSRAFMDREDLLILSPYTFEKNKEIYWKADLEEIVENLEVFICKFEIENIHLLAPTYNMLGTILRLGYRRTDSIKWPPGQLHLDVPLAHWSPCGQQCMATSARTSCFPFIPFPRGLSHEPRIHSRRFPLPHSSCYINQQVPSVSPPNPPPIS